METDRLHAALLGVPAVFEQQMIHDELELYEKLLLDTDEEDRVPRKCLERLKEGSQECLESLATPKDDLVTIAEIGVDHVIVDEAQEFRKLSFATNMSTLKGVDPNGSPRAGTPTPIITDTSDKCHRGAGNHLPFISKNSAFGNRSLEPHCPQS